MSTMQSPSIDIAAREALYRKRKLVTASGNVVMLEPTGA